MRRAYNGALSFQVRELCFRNYYAYYCIFNFITIVIFSHYCLVVRRLSLQAGAAALHAYRYDTSDV